MQIGKIIKDLRLKIGMTQEELAGLLGVSMQAVSRWETETTFPDITLLPIIANVFNVTTDKLLGYECERDKKVDDIITRVDTFKIKTRSDDEWVDECVSILREGLAEFPQNEKLMITLADTLGEAGWRRHKEWIYYDDEGYIQHKFEVHKKNEYWTESIKLCEKLIGTTHDNAIFTKATNILVLLYRNIGENEKAVTYAKRMPELCHCRELLLASATDGKKQAKYNGELLLEMASTFSTQIVYGLMCNKNNYKTDMPIEKIKGAISLFYLVCEDGNLGNYHGKLIQLYLYLSRVQWERGYKDDAFVSLNDALKQAIALEKLCDGKEHSYTAPLVLFVKMEICDHQSIVEELPNDWPWWYSPDYAQVEKEIKADPRWIKWVQSIEKNNRGY